MLTADMALPSTRPPRAGQDGYAMAALVVGIAVMGVLASVAMPVLSQTMQREKEAELIFRGEQYARAVGLFQRKFGPGSLPPNLDTLFDQRFLRKKYKDPITGKDFRPVTMAEAASLSATPMPAATATGANGQPGQLRNGGRGTAMGAFQGGTGTSGLGGIPTGLGAMPGGMGGQMGSPMGTPAGLPQGAGGAPPGGGLGQGGGIGQGGGLPGATGARPGQGGTGAPGNNQQGGIAGVVSRSTAASVLLYNGKDHYDQWGFVYNPTTTVAGGAAGATQGGAAGAIGPDGRPIPGAGSPTGAPSGNPLPGRSAPAPSGLGSGGMTSGGITSGGVRR